MSEMTRSWKIAFAVVTLVALVSTISLGLMLAEIQHTSRSLNDLHEESMQDQLDLRIALRAMPLLTGDLRKGAFADSIRKIQPYTRLEEGHSHVTVGGVVYVFDNDDHFVRAMFEPDRAHARFLRRRSLTSR